MFFCFFCSWRDPSSLTGDGSRAHCSGSTEAQLLAHHGIPTMSMLTLQQIRDTNPQICHNYFLVFTNTRWDALRRNCYPYFTDEETKTQRGYNGPMKIPVTSFPNTHHPSWSLYTLPFLHPSAWKWLGVGSHCSAF